MLGTIILLVIILTEIGFAVVSIKKESDYKREKSITRIAGFMLFVLLSMSPIINWGFQWYMLGLILLLQAVFGVLFLARRKVNSVPKNGKVIFVTINRVLMFVMSLFLLFIFPQYKTISTTGEYEVGSVSYTLTDAAREELFTEEEDRRKVSIQFWYPTNGSDTDTVVAEGKFPLVIFSHGAFGYRMSNYSTYQELASNGYVVCSIDHTYHAFMTKQEDGKTIITNMEFMNSAMGAQSGDIIGEELYELEQEWMELRTGDMAFVLEYIKEMTTSGIAEGVFAGIDIEHIGTFGHSMGGATAAHAGRASADVDAVIVIDGTMMGEVTGYEDGEKLYTKLPYPKPILNFYGEDHYEEAIKSKEDYPNLLVHKYAGDSYQVIIKGSGHMNFTDLSIISPFLSNMLGAGEVDARYCVDTMNKDILEFFDCYLKSVNIEIPKVRFQGKSS